MISFPVEPVVAENGMTVESFGNGLYLPFFIKVRHSGSSLLAIFMGGGYDKLSKSSFEYID
jgi:hypothetical protein